MSAVISERVPIGSADEINVNPLEPTIGAEISGIDLRNPLSDLQRDRIKALLLRHRVLFFRDQKIDSGQQIAFARRFGKIYEHPSTRQVDHRARGETGLSHRISATLARAERKTTHGVWHSDTSWLVRPSWGAVLRAVDLPPLGGDTIWADGHAVYEALPQEVREQIRGLHVIHDFQSSLKRVDLDYPVVAHPLVRRHPETGENIVWVNFSQNPSIVGWDLAESRALLDRIHAEYNRPEVQVRFKWTQNAIAFWDNRAGLHYAVSNYGDYPRELERVLIEDFDALPHY